MNVLYENKVIHIYDYVEGLQGNAYQILRPWQNYKYLQDYFFEHAKMRFDSYTARGIDPLEQDSQGETELSKYKPKQKVKSANDKPIKYKKLVRKLIDKKTLNNSNSKPSRNVETLTKKKKKRN